MRRCASRAADARSRRVDQRPRQVVGPGASECVVASARRADVAVLLVSTCAFQIIYVRDATNERGLTMAAATLLRDENARAIGVTACATRTVQTRDDDGQREDD